jgi:hypothetical protein
LRIDSSIDVFGRYLRRDPPSQAEEEEHNSESSEPSSSQDLKVQGDGSFTPYALKKIEEVFRLFDEDQDGMWNVTEWNKVSSALGEQSNVDVGQLKELAKSVDGVSLHDGKGFRLESVINIFKASDDLESDLHKIDLYTKKKVLFCQSTRCTLHECVVRLIIHVRHDLGLTLNPLLHIHSYYRRRKI